MRCISAVFAVIRCLSVRPSVTFVSCAKTNKDIFEIFYHRVATPFWFSHTKGDADIPTGTPLTGASNAFSVIAPGASPGETKIVVKKAIFGLTH